MVGLAAGGDLGSHQGAQHVVEWPALQPRGLEHLGCLGLHWEDIDLEARTLTVRRRVNRVGRIGLIIREGAWTESGSRTVILPQAVVQVLRTTSPACCWRPACRGAW